MLDEEFMRCLSLLAAFGMFWMFSFSIAMAITVQDAVLDPSDRHSHFHPGIDLPLIQNIPLNEILTPYEQWSVMRLDNHKAVGMDMHIPHAYSAMLAFNQGRTDESTSPSHSAYEQAQHFQRYTNYLIFAAGALMWVGLVLQRRS